MDRTQDVRRRAASTHLALDELLGELLHRTQEIVGVRDGLWRLIEAIVQVASAQLTLATVLDRVVEVARDMVDAEYAALGVIARDGTLCEFVHVGIDDDTVQRIGHLPEGHGILGLLVTEPRVLRLDDLSDHPASVGFPTHHPPMDTFLGVPVRVGDRIYGNLYLTNRRDGRPFTEDDAELVTTLATAAGVVIDNARLHESALRRQRWLEVNRDLAGTLLSGADSARIQRFIVDRILALTGGVTCLLALTDADAMAVVAGAGRYAEDVLGHSFMLDGSASQQAIDAGSALAVDDPTAVGGAGELPTPIETLGATMVLPLCVQGAAVGVVIVAREKGSEPFTTDDLAMADDLAAQVAVALDYDHAQTQRRRAAVFGDRERIGHDLHDLVIQRLFATGLSLDGLAGRVDDPTVAERLGDAVDEIDAAIADLRSSIFGLHARRHGSADVADQVAEICEAAGRLLGFPPELDVDPAAAAAVPDEIVPDLLATLRELVSNAARHAQASRVEVRLHRPAAETLQLDIVDDGRGIPTGGRRSGLANLAARAERLQGAMTVTTGDTGTTIVWRVSLR